MFIREDEKEAKLEALKKLLEMTEHGKAKRFGKPGMDMDGMRPEHGSWGGRKMDHGGFVPNPSKHLIGQEETGGHENYAFGGMIGEGMHDKKGADYPGPNHKEYNHFSKGKEDGYIGRESSDEAYDRQEGRGPELSDDEIKSIREILRQRA